MHQIGMELVKAQTSGRAGDWGRSDMLIAGRCLCPYLGQSLAHAASCPRRVGWGGGVLAAFPPIRVEGGEERQEKARRGTKRHEEARKGTERHQEARRGIKGHGVPGLCCGVPGRAIPPPPPEPSARGNALGCGHCWDREKGGTPCHNEDDRMGTC